MEDKDFETKIIRAKVPKTCVCPQCEKAQTFKRHKRRPVWESPGGGLKIRMNAYASVETKGSQQI